MAAHAAQLQQAFDDWVERKLFLAIDEYLEMSEAGKSPWPWGNRDYGLTTVEAIEGGLGVYVTTDVENIPPILEAHYRAEYVVNTTASPLGRHIEYTTTITFGT